MWMRSVALTFFSFVRVCASWRIGIQTGLCTNEKHTHHSSRMQQSPFVEVNNMTCLLFSFPFFSSLPLPLFYCSHVFSSSSLRFSSLILSALLLPSLLLSSLLTSYLVFSILLSWLSSLFFSCLLFLRLVSLLVFSCNRILSCRRML